MHASSGKLLTLFKLTAFSLAASALLVLATPSPEAQDQTADQPTIQKREKTALPQRTEKVTETNETNATRPDGSDQYKKNNLFLLIFSKGLKR